MRVLRSICYFWRVISKKCVFDLEIEANMFISMYNVFRKSTLSKPVAFGVWVTFVRSF